MTVFWKEAGKEKERGLSLERQKKKELRAMIELEADETLERLRAICLSFPEASEEGGVGSPSFKVRKKIFAMRHMNQERSSLWCKAPSGAQEILVNADPQRFFVPPYVGHHGWIGIWLDAEIDWEEVTDLISESYRMTAPKRLREQKER